MREEKFNISIEDIRTMYNYIINVVDIARRTGRVKEKLDDYEFTFKLKDVIDRGSSKQKSCSMLDYISSINIILLICKERGILNDEQSSINLDMCLEIYEFSNMYKKHMSWFVDFVNLLVNDGFSSDNITKCASDNKINFQKFSRLMKIIVKETKFNTVSNIRSIDKACGYIISTINNKKFAD